MELAYSSAVSLGHGSKFGGAAPFEIPRFGNDPRPSTKLRVHVQQSYGPIMEGIGVPLTINRAEIL